jgi:putative RecB family exonuclease
MNNRIETEEADLRIWRSVSQLKQYERCPYSYKLSRIDKVWQRPAAWLAQGSAVHEAGEAWERSGRTMSLEEAQEVFRESYQRHIREALGITPNMEYWFRSGPYDGERDIERRYHIGLEQVAKYIEWYTKHPEEVIWIAPDGEPGIELGFQFQVQDLVWVRGFIDAIVVDENGNLVVRDNKTGKLPGDDFQLGVYGVGIAEKFGVPRPLIGDYWMGVSGKPTYPYDLGDWSEEAVKRKFLELEENIQSGRFEPDPEPSKCTFCDVNASCDFAIG